MEAPDDFYTSLMSTMDDIGAWQEKNSPLSAIEVAKGATLRRLDAELLSVQLLLFALGGQTALEARSSLDQRLINTAFAEIVGTTSCSFPMPLETHLPNAVESLDAIAHLLDLSGEWRQLSSHFRDLILRTSMDEVRGQTPERGTQPTTSEREGRWAGRNDETFLRSSRNPFNGYPEMESCR